MKKTKAPSTKKSGAVIRVAVIQNPATKRPVCVRVTADGRLGKRDAEHLHVKKIGVWREVEAATWAEATKAARAGRGKVVRSSAARPQVAALKKAA